MTEYVTIEHRALREVCTDHQRRCYNGAWFSSEMQWSGWEVLDSFCPPDRVDERLAYWRRLNAYAVRERGEGARKEFRVKETTKSRGKGGNDMMTTEEWNDKQTGSNDGRADLSSPLGAVAMREAAIAEVDCGGCYGKCVDPANCRLDDVAAIRAIPLPDHAAQIAAAMRLPEVAAMLNLLQNARFLVPDIHDKWHTATEEAQKVLRNALEAKP